ncbi:MAG: metallophosphoesterase [Agathobacter sp.]|nr:metallophosphoesterase [Agathobacter sp.]
MKNSLLTRANAIKVENGLAVRMPSDRPIRIAHFTDIHFGVVGRGYHNNRPERTKAYMQYVVDTQKPDLIVCTGDIVMTSGVEKLGEFVELMESYKIPWTFVFGNHDAEGEEDGYNKESYSKYLDSCDAEYLLYNTGYVEEENNRYGNFSISVLNSDGTKLVGAIISIDTGTYNREINSYDSITETQIAWYKEEIDRLDALYEGEGTIPSVVFGHIALPEFQTGYKAALAKNGARFVIEQELSEDGIEDLKNEGPTNTNTGFFSVMKEKGSTKAFLCGHAHVLNFQVEMDGIVLGFGPQTGFSTIFINNDMPRETYIYCLEENFDFTTISCVEEGNNLGLEYSGTFDATAEYDEAKGVYTTSYNFNYGNNIEFSYKGVRLTTENTQITGDFSASTTSTWKGGFYSPDGKKLVYDGTAAGTCTFIYDPSKKTLHIETREIEANPDAPTSVNFSTIDCDAGADAIALWTEAGTKLKWVTDASIGTVDWIGNNWRYYVVVDSEGRIAYAVLWPATGYGDPGETNYYAHPCYADYRSNPAISILDGFAEDYAAGGIGHKLFEIVIPEGGFAFTGHDSAIFKMIDMLSQGTVADYSASYVNTRSLLKSSIRVSYDLEERTIAIYTVEK